MDGPPKSALELAMEKLKRQDETAGVEAAALSEAQVAAIAEARRTHAAQVAECEILIQSALAAAADPNAREELLANHRRDLARFATDRDRRIARIRGEEAQETAAPEPRRRPNPDAPSA